MVSKWTQVSAFAKRREDSMVIRPENDMEVHAQKMPMAVGCQHVYQTQCQLGLALN